MSIELPEILNFPPKLLPIITELHKYRYFLIEGGRGSGKSNAAARMILYLSEINKNLRVVCGREIKGRLDESVHALLGDLIRDYELAFQVLDNEMRHLISGSEINFRGFRESGGKTNVRGMEGVDVLWVDEAQQLTDTTLTDLIPTIRKDTAKIFFTMNRHLVDDPVRDRFISRPDCLHIEINYFDNPFCTQSSLAEAEELKERNIDEYNHVWLNYPLQQEDDFLFPQTVVRPMVDMKIERYRLIRRVIGIDFAAGGDKCVIVQLDKMNHQHWVVQNVVSWREPNTMASVGRIVNTLAELKPDVAIMDIGGLGLTAWQRMVELGVDIKGFDGSKTGGDTYGNLRAQAYYMVRKWFEDRQLVIPSKQRELIRQIELVKSRYASSGKRYILEKPQLKKIMGCSPDEVDALMMAVYAATQYLTDALVLANPSNNMIKVKKRTGRRW